MGHLDQSTMSSRLVLADIQKAFLQIGVREKDRDAFLFLFNINDKEQHLRFTRVPFRGDSRPFLLGATLNYHNDQQGEEFQETVQALRQNTYVDNLMQTGEEVEELEKFKEKQPISWQVRSFLSTNGNLTLSAWKAKTQQTLARFLGQNGTRGMTC